MMLEELQIEGFRSLKSVTWKPGRLNVLIGPNGGGKSNLLRALDLLRVAATGGLRDAILRMGGMAPLVWDGEARQICLKLTTTDECSQIDECSEPSSLVDLLYELKLNRLGNTGGFEVGTEQLSKRDGPVAGTGPPLIPTGTETGRYRPGIGLPWPPAMTIFSRDTREVPAVVKALGLRREFDVPASETVLSHWSTAAVGADAGLLQQNVSGWSIYYDTRVDQEAEVRRAAVTRADRRIDPDGQNLVAVLHTLYENEREFEQFLDKAMAAAFPGDYDKLSFPPAEDGRTQLRIRRKQRKRADSASDLSDGTLRFLLLLAILGSPDPAPLIAIDEPETGLHPRMLPIIAEVAANAALKAQVILTTHSPKLLDAFSEDLPTTTVVTWNGSETEMKTIDNEELKRWVENYSLGKFAFSGEAEAVS